jgi:hypothetical protein
MSGSIGDEYNILLSGEISAVETYDLALRRNFDAEMTSDLNSCRNCHCERVEQLTQLVVDNGVEPCTGSGPYGAIAKMIEDSASTPKAALQLLEELEAERLVQYESQTKLVSPEVLPVLQNVLLPAQHKTHLVISSRLRDLPDVKEVA